jgi:hypothetical protein
VVGWVKFLVFGDASYLPCLLYIFCEIDLIIIIIIIIIFSPSGLCDRSIISTLCMKFI